MERKEFIRNLGAIAFCAACGALPAACKKENNSDTVPYVPVNFQMDLNSPDYVDLSTIGGYVYVDNQGARGIFVRRTGTSEYIALDRNCTHKPSGSCAVVSVNTSNILECPCHGSQYELDGSVHKGPTTLPLVEYTTSLNGNILTITN